MYHQREARVRLHDLVGRHPQLFNLASELATLISVPDTASRWR
jgi:hypothetical protein